LKWLTVYIIGRNFVHCHSFNAFDTHCLLEGGQRKGIWAVKIRFLEETVGRSIIAYGKFGIVAGEITTKVLIELCQLINVSLTGY